MYQKINYQKFPPLLKEIPNPPSTLYYRGNKDLLNKHCISIIGTRKNSDYGSDMTQQIVKALSVLDIAIVSGLAYGIDSIAHRAALDYKIPTIAVLGSGIDNIYPKSNQSLAREITQNGLIISEYPHLTAPQRHHFPQRNRIVSGLSIATIIIEAPLKSGTLITAQFALEQGREVFAIPGDIDRENSQGCLHLIQKSGAYPLISPQDIVSALHQTPKLTNHRLVKETPVASIYDLNDEEKLVIESLPARRAIDIFNLQKKTKLSISPLLSTITLLELKTLVKKQGSKYLRNF